MRNDRASMSIAVMLAGKTLGPKANLWLPLFSPRPLCSSLGVATCSVERGGRGGSGALGRRPRVCTVTAYKGGVMGKENGHTDTVLAFQHCTGRQGER